MAVTKITPVKLKFNEFSAALTFTAPTSATEGFAVSFKEHDYKTVILCQTSNASAAKTVKVLKGDGIQGVADVEAYSLAAGAIAAINVEAGAHKILTGDNKGSVIVIPESTDIKIAAVVTP